MEKIKMLEMIDEKVKVCQKCEELVVNRDKTVFGSGNPDARVMLLGEAPGRSESETGLPFVGKAGELLTNIILAAGWTRDEVYIANICKCRPPQNRTPRPSEAANCRPFLDLQIKVVNPAYIVCLGNVAAQNLLGVETPISSLRGQLYEYNGRKVLCTYHPSFLLRKPEAKKDVWEDLQLLLQSMKGEGNEAQSAAVD